MVHMSRDTTVLLKMKKTAEQMAEALSRLSHRKACPQGGVSNSIAKQMQVDRRVIGREHRMDHPY